MKIKTYYRPHRKKRRRKLRRFKKGISLPTFSLPSLPSISLAKLLLGLLVVVLLSGLAGHFYLRHQIQDLRAKKEDLLLTKSRLSAKISRLKKDPKAYEEIARRQYGLVKDNERLVIFR
ncbi:MAG: septum formation initiator family protein [Thermodesulfobacteria bacterium]|nr:septum formation initiator family protein [Thermodesulfobacteriota bacterium]